MRQWRSRRREGQGRAWRWAEEPEPGGGEAWPGSKHITVPLSSEIISCHQIPWFFSKCNTSSQKPSRERGPGQNLPKGGAGGQPSVGRTSVKDPPGEMAGTSERLSVPPCTRFPLPLYCPRSSQETRLMRRTAAELGKRDGHRVRSPGTAAGRRAEVSVTQVSTGSWGRRRRAAPRPMGFFPPARVPRQQRPHRTGRNPVSPGKDVQHHQYQTSPDQAPLHSVTLPQLPASTWFLLGLSSSFFN